MGFGLYANKSVNLPLVHDKTNKQIKIKIRINK